MMAHDYNEVGLSSNSSRLGFKAEQKLENGMNRIWSN